jgi:hypothetical protein
MIKATRHQMVIWLAWGVVVLGNMSLSATIPLLLWWIFSSAFQVKNTTPSCGRTYLVHAY